MDHVCPNCGFLYSCDAPRHNKRGTGAWYADQIKALSPIHREILGYLEDSAAHSYDSGRTLAEVTFGINSWRRSSSQKSLKDQTVSARLSELQGLKMVSCVPAEVALTDLLTMRFENRNIPRWHLIEQRRIDL